MAMDTKSVFQGILILLAVVILAFLVFDYYKKSSQEEESFEDYAELTQEIADDDDEPSEPKPVVTKTESKPRPVEVTPKTKDFPKDCFPKDKLTPEDLLPRDAANSEWAQVNPAGQGDVQNQNFLTAGYHVGINSVGSTLRNANMQIRSEMPNPQMKVSPWMQSTIEPDLNRLALEINGCD
ncbi:hypothetical protein QKU58_gp107 [Pyramimonas orientalis virus]|uniref:Minor capsid protein P11 C-terminal conserved region domain-containing protein n=1 Tax=Pyramimonas orientalis virus 01B TaxID=3134525 RepID=A0A7M3UNG9_9VIRU|nr:hypothetical protein QKU58_gp107 [Pyramimonas orientalis virus]QOI90224.1 hypothetical protein HWQ62_00087 [Pyramimonas orientalis virus]